MNWEAVLAPYAQAVEELKIKLKGIRKQFEYESKHSPIEFITGRVKPIPSILEKAEERSIPLDRVEKTAGHCGGSGCLPVRGRYIRHCPYDPLP